MLQTRRVLALSLLLVLTAPKATPCEFALGYFYQVTALRGQVVGTDAFILHSFRSWRQSVARKHAKLTLYEYRWPVHSLNELPLVKTIFADANGRFDFGPLKNGHYTLVVDGQFASDERGLGTQVFDVEMKELPRVTESVLIDVSPFTPDCMGGHEFIVKLK